MKTFIKNIALVLVTIFLLALISYSWAEEKGIKSITVYSHTPPSGEIRYLQKIEYEGIHDPVFKFSKDGGKTWETHDKNPITNENTDIRTGNMYGDMAAGILTVLANRIEFNEKYNTAHPLGRFYPNIFSSNNTQTKNLIEILKRYHDFIDGKPENNTPENRLKFLKTARRSVYHVGSDSRFDTDLEELFKKLETLKGDATKLSQHEQNILNIELEYLERDYDKWLLAQKALELYSYSLFPGEVTPELLKSLELYDVSTIDLVRQALATKARAETAATSSPQQACPK